MRIGPYQLANNLALAPMAGVTDLPFRLLCRRMGAGIAAGEMLTSNVRLWNTEKSRRRMDHSGEPEPRVVQIAGGDGEMMAEAARRHSFLYGLVAVLVSLALGWAAAWVFRRRF